MKKATNTSKRIRKTAALKAVDAAKTKPDNSAAAQLEQKKKDAPAPAVPPTTPAATEKGKGKGKPATPNDGNPYPRTKLRGVLFAEGAKGFNTEAELFDRVHAVMADRKWRGEKATREQIERGYKVVTDPKHRFNSKRSRLEKQGEGGKLVKV